MIQVAGTFVGSDVTGIYDRKTGRYYCTDCANALFSRVWPFEVAKGLNRYKEQYDPLVTCDDCYEYELEVGE